MHGSGSEEVPFFNSISIVGLGLIGGSLAKALRLKGYQGILDGYEPNLQTLEQARQSGLFTALAASPGRSSLGETEVSGLATKPAELVIIAVPLGKLREAMVSALPLIGPETVVMDVGSVKGTVHETAADVLAGSGAIFIGGHPMAGSEKGGFNAGSPILFENAYFFLTPDPRLEGAVKGIPAVELLKQLVLTIGGLPVITDPKAHDALTARLSHLPHLTASILVEVFAASLPTEQLKFAGGGFRDSTRIAMGDPALWRDIFVHNRSEVISSIDTLVDGLMRFRKNLQDVEDEAIVETLGEAQRLRSGLITIRPSEEVSLYPLRLELEDRPGILAEVTTLLAEHQLDIKDLALDHSRENQRGAFTLSFASNADRLTAASLLKASGIGIGVIDSD
jgi:prephenate dehydrogenase